jgi:hypothetical protein
LKRYAIPKSFLSGFSVFRRGGFLAPDGSTLMGVNEVAEWLGVDTSSTSASLALSAYAVESDEEEWGHEDQR